MGELKRFNFKEEAVALILSNYCTATDFKYVEVEEIDQCRIKTIYVLSYSSYSQG